RRGASRSPPCSGGSLPQPAGFQEILTHQPPGQGMGAAKLGLGRQEEVADPALLENALGGRAAGSQRGPALGAVEESQRRAHMAFDAGAVIERDVGIGAKM